jgi:biotin carboxyl carrier protein
VLINRFTPKIKVETPIETPVETPVWDEIEHEAPSLVFAAETSHTEALDAESEVIVSPGPGTVLVVKAFVGEHVKNGDLLLTLDAMDMEYEINATKDGIVTQVLISEGAAVDSGTPLIEIQ